MKCKHYKGVGWTYTINDTEKLQLSEQCTIKLIMDIHTHGGRRVLVKEPSKTEDLNDLTTGDGVYKGA